MRRFLFSFWAMVIALGSVLGTSSCSSSPDSERNFPAELDASRREGSFVEPIEGGTIDATSKGPAPECSTYCDTVLESCKERQAQYASRAECMAFCAHLPQGKAGDTDGDSVACRQFYAGSPAKTNSATYCGAAGPFGGGTCGDRCPIFCSLTLAVCAPEATSAPYPSYPDCQTACLGFSYKDGGVDGGGEVASGPSYGNTLNCRLFFLRQAVVSGSGCANLAAESPTCY